MTMDHGIDWNALHPIGRQAFMALAEDLAKSHQIGMTYTLFCPFEGYRSPDQRSANVQSNDSEAEPWQSAHHFGLAVDFVPWINGVWSWSLTADWDFLRKCAEARGLLHRIDWDCPHVEHPAFERIRLALLPDASSSTALSRTPNVAKIGLPTELDVASSRVQVGMMGVNVPIPVPVAYHTFGGWKRSAFGDANQRGMEGVRFWTKVKTVTARCPEARSRTRPSSSPR